MDLTRGTKTHGIGGLNAKESATLMRDFCRHCGMNSSGHEACLEALAGEALRCDGDQQSAEMEEADGLTATA